MSKPFRGYFGIAMTPFDAEGNVLWDDLQRECDFCVRAGIHGLVWPVNDSEYTTLSFVERVQGTKLVVEAIAHRIPVMIGVADTSQAGAVALAQVAAQAGADSVIAMPPWHIKLANKELVENYYRAIAQVAGVPVCIQNLDPPVGSGLSSALCVELCQKIPLVQYVKEEREPHGTFVSELVSMATPDLKGVFTGGTQLGLIASFRRGAAGNMAATYVPDLDAQIWDLMEAGKEAEARRIQDAWCVLEKIVRATPGSIARKEILVRRGIFRYNCRRNMGAYTLDEHFRYELDHALDVVAPYFKG